MPRTVEIDLRNLVFRASREYQLVQTGRLPARLKIQRPSFSAYGFFVPNTGADRWNEVVEASSEAALVFLTLRRPGTLPSYLGDLKLLSQEKWFRELLSRGVLEVRVAGEFITGLPGLRELNGQGAASSPIQSPLAELSDAGIRYGYRYCCLENGDQEDSGFIDKVAMRLYYFNTVPPPADLRSRLSKPEGIFQFLGAEAPVTVESTGLVWAWQPNDSSDWWRYWVPTNGRKTTNGFETFQGRKERTEAKLYISPTLADTPRAVEIVLPIISESSAVAMKVGSFLGGLTRPDKMVAYFSDERDLVATASRIAAATRRLTVHGVPFTSDLAGNGLLSWASDDFSHEIDNPDASSSWRILVTRSLARGLVESYRLGHPIEVAVEHAKSAAEVAGIDTVNWLPNGLMPSRFGEPVNA